MDPQPHRHHGHGSRHRPRSLAERLWEWLDMPRLPRRQRNERVAIAVAIVLVTLYLLLRPVVERYFPSAPSAPTIQTEQPPPAQTKPGAQPAKSKR